MRGENLPVPLVTPTAQRPPPGMAVTAEKPVAPVPGLGLGSMDHWPFTPCSIRVRWLPDDESMYQPTAEGDPSAAVAAPNKPFSPPPWLGELTSDRLDAAPGATSCV